MNFHLFFCFLLSFYFSTVNFRCDLSRAEASRCRKFSYSTNYPKLLWQNQIFWYSLAMQWCVECLSLLIFKNLFSSFPRFQSGPNQFLSFKHCPQEMALLVAQLFSKLPAQAIFFFFFHSLTTRCDSDCFSLHFSLENCQARDSSVTFWRSPQEMAPRDIQFHSKLPINNYTNSCMTFINRWITFPEKKMIKQRFNRIFEWNLWWRCGGVFNYQRNWGTGNLKNLEIEIERIGKRIWTEKKSDHT